MIDLLDGFVADLRAARDRVVDRLVVRGDCLREPCASEGWVKLRMLGAGLAPGVATLAIASALGVGAIASTALPVAVTMATIQAAAARINDLAEQGHSCDLRGWDDVEDGGRSA